MAYDLLIKNGRVIDGSGMPAFLGDVGIRKGKIVEIGRLRGDAARTIDANGLVIAPGFIDSHCHFDAQVTWDPLCTFSCYHGATTVIIGNCSLGIAPVRPGTGERVSEFLSYVEAIPMDTLKTVTMTWETFGEYLDTIDKATYMGPTPNTTPHRMLGALGPRMVGLAGERTSGALTYFMPPEHTVLARGDIDSTNPAANLAVEQMIVLETDKAKARAIAVAGMTRYLRLPNYTNSLKRVGFTDADIDAGNGEPSQRLIDAVIVCGDEATIKNRVAEHHAAGANHVCIQVLTDTPQIVPMAQWNRLADALL